MSQDKELIGLLKQLRQMTNAPVSLCREALQVSPRELTRAVEYIRTRHRPIKVAEERAGRIASYVHQGRIGVLVEVRCATDFVANTEQFQTLCRELTLQVAGQGENDLLNQSYVRDPSQTVKELIASVSQQVDEPVSVKRVIRWEMR